MLRDRESSGMAVDYRHPLRIAARIAMDETSEQSLRAAVAALAERLQRVEETVSFADRAEESLTQELRNLDRQLRDLSVRVQRLETGVGTLDERLERVEHPREPEPPTT